MSSGNTYEYHEKSDFIAKFNHLARHKHRYEVFRDFIYLSTISLHNAVHMNEALENEYLSIAKQYNKDELTEFAQLLSILVDLLQPEPRDILGSLYMELDLGNKQTGQFFTPPEVSIMMAKMLHGDDLEQIEKPFITLSEPASGAGGMVLAFANVMIEKGHNPTQKLWCQCVDIDRLAAYMCFVQLSLWNIPAEIIVGNALSLEFRETLYTPAHYLFRWEDKLLYREMGEKLSQIIPDTTETDELVSLPSAETLKAPSEDSVQFDFGF